MKKLTVSLGVFSFALFFVLLSCDTKKPEGATSSLASIPKKEAHAPTPGSPSPQGPGFISGADLAFRSYLFDPKAKIDQVKSIYKAVEEEKMAIASAVTPSYDKRMVMYSEICKCPGTSTGVCPCPPDTTASIAISDASAKVFYGSTEMKTKNTDGNAKSELRAFKWPTTMAEGQDTLTIVAKFGGKEARKYRVPVVFNGGKLYFMWPK